MKYYNFQFDKNVNMQMPRNKTQQNTQISEYSIEFPDKKENTLAFYSDEKKRKTNLFRKEKTKTTKVS